MIYAIQANVELNTRVHMINLKDSVKDKLVGKPLWSDDRNPTTITDGVSEAGNPSLNIMARFPDKADRDEVASYLRGRIAQIPALSGEVRIHRCFHDEGKPCEAE